MPYLPANNSNPFKQSALLWRVELSLPFKAVGIFAEQLGECASSVSCFEEQASPHFESQPEDIWKLQLYCEQHPDSAELLRRIALLSASLNIFPPALTIAVVADTDWVSQVQDNFPPLYAGRYFVHGSHYKDIIPHTSYPLHIDAGRAFGTGEHETTYSCLQAIDKLAKKRHFSHMLDMGCGSGILAIAMAKTWKKPVVAVDIDTQSVQVTHNNARINRCSAFITAGLSNGYRSRLVRCNTPYDLIASNILAKPLVAFAPDLAKHLAPGGIAILSGLLTYQEQKVLAAHRMQGLRLVERIERNSWSTLILEHA